MSDKSDLSQWQQYTLRLLELQNQRHEQEIERLIQAFNGSKAFAPSQNLSEIKPMSKVTSASHSFISSSIPTQSNVSTLPFNVPATLSPLKTLALTDSQKVINPGNVSTSTPLANVQNREGILTAKPTILQNFVPASSEINKSNNATVFGGNLNDITEIKTTQSNNRAFQNTPPKEPPKSNSITPANTLTNVATNSAPTAGGMATKPVTFSFASVASEAASKGNSGLFGGNKSNENKTFSSNNNNLLFQFTPGSNRAVAVKPVKAEQNDSLNSNSISTTDASLRQEAKNSDEEAEEFVPDVEFTPVIPLPSLVEVKTGEEDDEVLLTARCKLYRYDKTINENKERGLGEIKDYSDEKEGLDEVFTARFKDSNIAKEFVSILKNAVQ